jgi:prefoldin subunit 5
MYPAFRPFRLPYRRSYTGEIHGKSLQQLQMELAELQERVAEVKNTISSFRDDSQKRVLFLGAGLSSTIAIEYLCKHAKKEGFLVRVGDADYAKAEAKVPSIDILS